MALIYIGILDISDLNPNRGGGWTGHGAIAYRGNGTQYALPKGGGSAVTSYGASLASGDIVGIAFDVDADTVTFYKNNSSQGNTTNGLSHISSNGVYSFFVYGDNDTYIVNTGQDSSFVGTKTAQGNTDANGNGDFYYAPPSGYLALCSANLPEPTIGPNSDTQADDYFNTALWTGNATDRDITDVGFAAVCKLPLLRKLSMYNCRNITDHGLLGLKSYLVKLEELYIIDCGNIH